VINSQGRRTRAAIGPALRATLVPITTGSLPMWLLPGADLGSWIVAARLVREVMRLCLH